MEKNLSMTAMTQKQQGDDGYLEEWIKEQAGTLTAEKLIDEVINHMVAAYKKANFGSAIFKDLTAHEVANIIKNTSENENTAIFDKLGTNMAEEAGSNFKSMVSDLINVYGIVSDVTEASDMIKKINDYNESKNPVDMIRSVSSIMSNIGNATNYFGPIGSYFTFYFKIGADIISGMENLKRLYDEHYDRLNRLYDELSKAGSSKEADELVDTLMNGSMDEYYAKKQMIELKAIFDKWLSSKGAGHMTTQQQLEIAFPEYRVKNQNIIDLTNKIKNKYYEKTTETFREEQDHEYLFNNGVITKIKQDVDDASHQQKVDPLIFDIDGDGLKPTSILDGAYFDLDGNGKKERMSWVGSGDGLLVYDRTENGVIDNGKELFSNFTILANGTQAQSGLQALVEFDENKDGIIDEKDSIFSKLRLWMDNGDGISEAGELKTLKELGIKSISLKTKGNIVSFNGIEIRNEGTYSKDDGTTGEFGEIWTKPNYADSIEKETVEISEEVKKLPAVRSFGNLASLQQAIMKDETGRIRELIGKIISTSDVKAQETLTKELLKIMSGADNIASNSRGGYIDAKELAVIEAFTGEKYVGKDGANPNNAAAPILKETYKDIIRTYLIQIMMKGILKEYTGYFSLTENNILNVNVDRLSRYIKLDIAEGRDVENVLAGLSYILSNDGTESNAFFKFAEQFKNTSYVEIILKSNENSMIGTSGNDVLNGTSKDNYIVGNLGNDYLAGGAGNDTYIYRKGDGYDTIYDYEGNNIIQLKDINPEDIYLRKYSSYEIDINIKDGGRIRLTYALQNVNARNYSIVFEDGTIWTKEDIVKYAKVLEGTSGSDTLDAMFEESKLYGREGNDTLNGSSGDDREGISNERSL
ncbi:hypothetical protein ACWG0P_15690 [Amedibacillus sp. YH-ame6]